MELPNIICVVGPTASGKTDAGIAIAKAVDGEVICADSRTIYRGMDIGTAKPKGERMTAALSGLSLGAMFGPPGYLVEDVPHWGLDLVEPDQPFSVSDFQKFADEKIADIISRGKVPVIVGGTGLYIRAILDRPNFAQVAPSQELRDELEAMTDNELIEEIAARDPDTAAAIDDRNRRRMLRALEILRLTGKPIEREFGRPIYNALQIGMDVEREALYARIDQRVDVMVGSGLVDEVRKLREQYGSDSNAMTGIGYRQICEFFDGKVKLREAVLRIKYDSHHYAKRQLTWFAKDQRIVWVDSVKDAVELAKKFLL